MRHIIITSALLLALGVSAMAQPGATEQRAQQERISDKQVVETYNKFPDPNGENQDFTATTYETKPGDNVYEDSYIRYNVENEANDGVPYRPTIKVIEESADE